jgi:hypothetical protein
MNMNAFISVGGGQGTARPAESEFIRVNPTKSDQNMVPAGQKLAAPESGPPSLKLRHGKVLLAGHHQTESD